MITKSVVTVIRSQNGQKWVGGRALDPEPARGVYSTSQTPVSGLLYCDDVYINLHWHLHLHLRKRKGEENRRGDGREEKREKRKRRVGRGRKGYGCCPHFQLLGPPVAGSTAGRRDFAHRSWKFAGMFAHTCRWHQPIENNTGTCV